MSTTPQHELHPDAELLNAFAERALADHERSHVLAHLAVCGRCRQVLALSQEAVGVEAEELVAAAAAPAAVAATPLRVMRRRSWWRNWHLAWIPAAALTAAISLVAYVQITHVQHPAEMARNSPPAVKPNETTTKPAPQPQPKVPSPIPSTDVTAGASEPSASHHEARETAKPVLQPEAAAPAPMAAPAPTPPPAATETVVVTQDAAAPETVSSQQVTRIEPQPLARAKSLQTAAASNAPLAKKEPQADLKAFAARDRQAEKPSEQDHLAAVQAMPMQAAQSAGNASAPGTKPSAPANRAGSVETFGALRGASAVAATGGEPIHLPSGLAVASLVSANHLLLALDRSGTLFVSTNAGETWQRVAPRWTGRAILVRTEPSSAPPAAAASSLQGAGRSADASQQVAPATIFEIVNDQNQLWRSTNGIDWTKK